MSTLNRDYVFAFVFKKMAARFPEISCEEIEKLAEKVVNRNTVKTTKTWMNVRKSWAESKGLILTMTLSNTKLKNWMNVSRDSLPKFAKAMAPTMSRTAKGLC